MSARPRIQPVLLPVLGAWSWALTARGVLVASLAGPPVLLEDLLAVGQLVASQLPGRVVLVHEKPFRKSNEGFATLTRRSEAVVGPLRRFALEERQPLARQWRRLIRASSSARAPAKAHAILCAPLLVEGLGALGEREDVAEAAILAYYGFVAPGGLPGARWFLGVDPGAKGAAVLLGAA